MMQIQTSFSLNPTAANEREQLAEVASQFEAIFVRQMLAEARKTNFGSDLFDSQGVDTFRTMMDERVADIIAENGTLGFGKSIVDQLAQHLGPATAENAEDQKA